jgi:hypothetical protein
MEEVRRLKRYNKTDSIYAGEWSSARKRFRLGRPKLARWGEGGMPNGGSAIPSFLFGI